MSRTTQIALLAILVLTLQLAALAGEAEDAISMYNQHQYAPAAAKLEGLIRVRPTANLCYYGALSNRSCGKVVRARQLFQYVVTNFPTSTEARYAQQVLDQEKKSTPAPVAATPATVAPTATSNELPDSVKNAMPPEMQKLLSTPAGKKALEEIMRTKQHEMATIREAEQKGVMNQSKINAAVQQAGISDARSHGDKDHAFTPEDIARDGSAGIDQSRYPNCWFEASMAALADLARGQRLLASMIKRKNDRDYIVRFPQDGVEYMVTQQSLLTSGIRDKALWASIIECAEIQKFPDNKGASGAAGDQSRLEVGLQCITGRKAEIVYPRSSNVQELSAFIGGALKSQNPVVCSTYDEAHFEGPVIVFPQHAYTVVGFDPTKNKITLRNPHGNNSKRFQLQGDPHHEEFEQLSGGLCKMSLSRFQKCFYSVARSFI